MPTRRYAEGTTVTVQASQAELQLLLVRRGADQIMTGWDAKQGAMVGFRINGHPVRLAIPKPDIKELWKRHPRTPREDLEAAEERRMWRALVLLVKAKLEAVGAGITTLEREFMPDLLLADGRQLSEWLEPQLEAMYSTGRMPPLLPAVGETGEPR